MRQYTSIKEDIPYLESEQGNTILQPDTCRFLKQALERAEIKLARKEETCRAFSGLFEKPAHHRRSDI
jgi:UTP:GlnB (protein PII) uridylyltransferase